MDIKKLIEDKTFLPAQYARPVEGCTVYEHTFTFYSPINLDSSFTRQQLYKRAKSEMTIGIHVNERTNIVYAYFVWGVPVALIEECGMLEIECNKDVIGYDGVFELPKQLTDKLQALGFNCDEVICE